MVALDDVERVLGRAIVAFWMQVWPKEWKSGSVASATSSGATFRSFGTTTAQLM